MLTQQIMFMLPDLICGLEKMWFIGDDFLASTFRVNFKLPSRPSYIKDNFKVTAFCSNRFNDKNSNTLSRLQISISSALNSSTYLPHYMVFALDNDLINYLNFKGSGQASFYGEWLEWLVKQVAEAV